MNKWRFALKNADSFQRISLQADIGVRCRAKIDSGSLQKFLKHPDLYPIQGIFGLKLGIVGDLLRDIGYY